MRNWSTDTTALEQDPEKYAIWKLEQLINFGLDDEKLDCTLLKRYFHRLQIDPARKKFLELLLDDTAGTHGLP